MEDRVRKVGVRRWVVHARVDPTWANSGHPSPLPVPLRSRLSGSSMSGTARVPAPQRKSRAIRRARESPRCRISASASANLLSTLAQQMGHPPKFSSLLYTYPLPPVKPQGVSFLTMLTLTTRSGSLRCSLPCSPPPCPSPRGRGDEKPTPESRQGGAMEATLSTRGRTRAKAGAVLAEATDLPYNACNLTERTR
jgi:hypothetical protein